MDTGLSPPWTEATSHPAFRIGQFWQQERGFTLNSGLVYEVQGWDEDYITVTRWTRPKIDKPAMCIRDTTTMQIRYDDLFPTDKVHTRVAVLRRKGSGLICLARRHQTPIVDPLIPSITPKWYRWIRDEVAKYPGYIPAIYTDGSYKEYSSVQAILQPTTMRRKASAAIIIKDNSPDWKIRPIISIKVDEGENIGTRSAYSMEFLSLAMAMTVAEGISTKAVVSDAKAVLDVLHHRKEALRNTRKTHSIPLQVIDRLLDAKAPMPEHINAHPEKSKPNRADWTADEWGN